MQLIMRTFTPNDYGAVVDIFNMLWPGYPTTEEQLRTEDKKAQQYSGSRFQRYVVEYEGHIIAFGHYDQPPRFFEPHRFRVDIVVHPHYQRQGIGSSLYRRIVEDLMSLETFSLWVKLREDMVSGMQFARQCDFYEELRVWELRQEVAAFDPAPYARLMAALAAQNIEIKTLQELEKDAERYQKLYDLMDEAGQDLPPTEHWRQPSYDEFLRDVSARWPECYFVAVQGGRYVGMSYLTPHKEEHSCGVGFTGVRRSYRRKGVALALKLRGMTYAQEHGYASMRTSVDASNQASLAVNERLGFVKQSAWIVFAKEFACQVVSLNPSSVSC